MNESLSLLEHVLVPVASEGDARTTAAAVTPYLRGHGGRVTVVHVIEKAGGAPDKASVEQREQEAEKIFEAFADALEPADATLETDLRYGTDVAETIIGAATDVGASAIVFTPRGGSRWMRLLTGDVSHSLVTGTDRPVVVLPDVVEDETTQTEEGDP